MLTRKTFYRTFIICFTLLLGATMLFACTPLMPSEYGDIEGGGVTMTTELATYEKSVEEILVTIRNNSGSEVSYGVMWTLEKLEGGEWKSIPFKAGTAWIEPLYLLENGSSDTFTVDTNILDYKLADGTYRVVKEISGAPVAAEFTVGLQQDAEKEVVSQTLSIYRCDDVYITNDTFSYGVGTISLPLTDSGYEISDCKLLFCNDGCDPVEVVSRAAQGYAPAYYVVDSSEFIGNYHTIRFSMELPEEMAADLKNQGVYEDFIAEHERNFHYLLTLDDTHYAYIHITPSQGTEKPKDEAIVVDGIARDAVVELGVGAAG